MRERTPGVWELRVPLGRDPVTGRPRQRSRTFRGTRRAAETALAQLIHDTATDRAPATEGTFGFLLERWIDRAARDLSPTTTREYRRIIRKTLEPELGDVTLRKLTGQHFEALYDRLLERGLTPASIGQVHAISRRALNEALRWEWITSNPALKARPPSVRRTEIVPPSVVELRKIIAAASLDDADLGLLLWVAAAIGARRGELCALRWQDVNGTTVRIATSVAVIGGQVTVKDTKTHQERRVAIDATTVGLLERHRSAMDERARLMAPGGVLVRDAFVFSREPDGSAPLRPDSVSQAFRRAARAAGLREAKGKGVRLHDLRHLNASLQLAAGVPVATVSKRLGHNKESTTTDIYSHVMPGSDESAADLLGRLLGE